MNSRIPLDEQIERLAEDAAETMADLLQQQPSEGHQELAARFLLVDAVAYLRVTCGQRKAATYCDMALNTRLPEPKKVTH